MVDFGRTAEDYAKFRSGFPPELLDRLSRYGIGLSGQAVLDLGTGTGTLARLFAHRGCRVMGLDPSESMLAEARRLAAEEGVDIEFRVGRAEATALPDLALDVVCAGQCWHWFDRPAAAREATRVLRTGGYIAIAHFDWLPLADNAVEATERLILEFNPAWKGAGGRGVYPRWYTDLGEAGFRGLESFTFDMDVSYSHEAWRGRVRASAGVGAALPAAEVSRFDDALARLLQERFPADPLAIPHRVFALIGVRP